MSLHTHVNNSGFPLQLAIANLVKEKLIDWNVLYEEHAWELDSDNGFIDIVIEDKYKTWLMNIECKRVRDSQWIFLKDSTREPARRIAKLWVSTNYANGENNIFKWVDIPMDPSSVQSSYCIVPGQDSKSRPMLERLAADVVRSTEALARQESVSLSDSYSELRIYQNVIVTTADLFVCETDIEKIDVSSGELDESSTFKKIPYVRFRKQVGAMDSNLEVATDANSLNNQIENRESTIFIVNSSYFMEFLNSCELPDNLAKFINRAS